jgi:hypothetical protein
MVSQRSKMSAYLTAVIIGVTALVSALGAMSPRPSAKHEFEKNRMYVQPPVKAGDNGHLLRVDLSAPTTITSVDYDCIGSPCGWVHPCDATQCNGHDVPVELKGTDAIWWGWSNSGDNCVLVFTVNYQ